MDRRLQQGRRAVRTDLFDRPDVRRPAGQASRHRAGRATRPDGSEQAFVGQPFTLSRTPSKIAAHAAGAGQHTDEVLKEFGFADSEIADLHKAKAV